MVKVTRISPISGKSHVMDLDITTDQVMRWNAGNVKIQDCFPNLTASEREFLLTGITDDEWDEIFPEDKKEEEDE